MRETVSTMQMRGKLGEMLNRVDLRHDEFIIERKGKPMAALVPVQVLEAMRAEARRHGLAILEAQRNSGLTQKQADDLALEAVAWARKQRKAKRTR